MAVPENPNFWKEQINALNFEIPKDLSVSRTFKDDGIFTWTSREIAMSYQNLAGIDGHIVEDLLGTTYTRVPIESYFDTIFDLVDQRSEHQKNNKNGVKKNSFSVAYISDRNVFDNIMWNGLLFARSPKIDHSEYSDFMSNLIPELNDMLVRRNLFTFPNYPTS